MSTTPTKVGSRLEDLNVATTNRRKISHLETSLGLVATNAFTQHQTHKPSLNSEKSVWDMATPLSARLQKDSSSTSTSKAIFSPTSTAISSPGDKSLNVKSSKLSPANRYNTRHNTRTSTTVDNCWVNPPSSIKEYSSFIPNSSSASTFTHQLQNGSTTLPSPPPSLGRHRKSFRSYRFQQRLTQEKQAQRYPSSESSSRLRYTFSQIEPDQSNISNLKSTSSDLYEADFADKDFRPIDENEKGLPLLKRSDSPVFSPMQEQTENTAKVAQTTLRHSNSDPVLHKSEFEVKETNPLDTFNKYHASLKVFFLQPIEQAFRLASKLNAIQSKNKINSQALQKHEMYIVYLNEQVKETAKKLKKLSAGDDPSLNASQITQLNDQILMLKQEIQDRQLLICEISLKIEKDKRSKKGLLDSAINHLAQAFQFIENQDLDSNFNMVNRSLTPLSFTTAASKHKLAKHKDALFPLLKVLPTLLPLFYDANYSFKRVDILALHSLLMTNISKDMNITSFSRLIAQSSLVSHFLDASEGSLSSEKPQLSALYDFLTDPCSHVSKAFLIEFIENLFKMQNYSPLPFPGAEKVDSIMKRASHVSPTEWGSPTTLNSSDIPLLAMRFSQKSVSDTLANGSMTLPEFASLIGNGKGWNGDPVLCVQVDAPERGPIVSGLDNRRLYSMIAAVRNEKGFPKINKTSIPIELLPGNVPIRALSQELQNRIFSIFRHAVNIYLQTSNAPGQSFIPHVHLLKNFTCEQLRQFCMQLSVEMVMRVRQIGFFLGSRENPDKAKEHALRNFTTSGFDFKQVKVTSSPF